MNYSEKKEVSDNTPVEEIAQEIVVRTQPGTVPHRLALAVLDTDAAERMQEEIDSLDNNIVELEIEIEDLKSKNEELTEAVEDARDILDRVLP